VASNNIDGQFHQEIDQIRNTSNLLRKQAESIQDRVTLAVTIRIEDEHNYYNAQSEDDYDI